MRPRLALSTALLAVCLSAGAAFAAWPPGSEDLEDAAALYRGTLNAREELVRDGTLAQPRGIEEALQFDRETHGCHRGPAHAYRAYGAPDPPPAPAKRPKAAAKLANARIRYPYRVFYRQALTLEERSLLLLRVDLGLSFAGCAEGLAEDGPGPGADAPTRRSGRTKARLEALAREPQRG